MNRLEVEGLSCGYKTPVTHEVDMDVRSGEVVALLGPNGAGKSTLIKCVMKLANKFAGRIYVEGHEVSEIPRRKLARLVAYVPQGVARAPPMKVVDVVLLGRIPHAGYLPTRRDVEAAFKSLKRLGIEHLAERRANELSGGQLQLVHIARALAQGGRLLLLDEPTSHLDLKHQLHVLETVKSLAREEQLAVLMAIHDINLALKYSDKVVVLKGGRVVFNGGPREVTPEVIAKAYDVKVHMIRDGDRYVVYI